MDPDKNRTLGVWGATQGIFFIHGFFLRDIAPHPLHVDERKRQRTRHVSARDVQALVARCHRLWDQSRATTYADNPALKRCNADLVEMQCARARDTIGG